MKCHDINNFIKVMFTIVTKFFRRVSIKILDTHPFSIQKIILDLRSLPWFWYTFQGLLKWGLQKIPLVTFLLYEENHSK